MDEIQRKLALIDKQLAWGAEYIHRQIISSMPLLFVVIGLIAGILVQSALTLSAGFWMILLALCTAAAVALYLVKAKNRPFIIAYVALSCFLCLGAIRLISFHKPEANDICKFVGDERKLATIRGAISTEPYIQKNEQWKFARFKPTDPSSSFYLKIYEVKAITGWVKATGTVRVRIDEPVLDLKAGDYIQVYCWLDKFQKVTNPGQFDIEKYLSRKKIYVAASVKSRDGIELLESCKTGISTEIKRKLTETARRALLGELSPEKSSRGLLEALLLGYRGNIDSSAYEAFRKTGLLHFISLSGMHLGILVGMIWWLCKTAGLMKRGRAAVCIIAIILFLLIVPPRAPTVRAAIIGFVFCASFFFRRRPNPINTLSLAAIILLLIRPTNLFEPGWQLSFASVLGILLFYRRFHFFLYEKITNLPLLKKKIEQNTFYRIISRLGSYILQLLSTGLTAWLGGAGILLYHFYTINPLTFLWTVIVFPFVALILIFGYLKLILSFLLPTAAWLLGIIVTGLSDALIWIVELLARLGISQILIGHVPMMPIILYYCLILFIGLIYLRRPLLKKAICIVMAMTLIVVVGITKWQRTHRDDLILHCLDVGHGQAILVQLPGRSNILFDAGSLYKSDIGRRIVIPFLHYKGINNIDAIIISHNDVDHINGIPEIVGNCKVGDVYSNQAFLMEMTTDPCDTSEFLNKWLSEKDLGIKLLNGNLNIADKAEIKIIWPNEQIFNDKTLGDNDKSVVSLIEFGERKILLCSDIEKFAQQKIHELYPGLKADVVVTPHHSSIKTLDADFLQRLGADISICSCSRTQYERLQAIKRKDKAESFYTARDGAVTICIDKAGRIKTAVFSKSQ